jgi:hypothetical protein
MRAEAILDKLFELAPTVRYAALYPGRGEPIARQRTTTPGDAATDRFDELVVNPTLIAITRQRGNIDCGGLEYVVVRYGRFFQLVMPLDYGHLTVCFDEAADPVAHAPNVRAICQQQGAIGARSRPPTLS